MKRTIMFILISLTINAPLLAQHTFNVQGVLRGANGKAVPNGNYPLTFNLYTAATGGSSIWSEQHNSVTITNGVYSVELGSVNDFSGVDFTRKYFLGLTVGSDPEMTPRLPLSSFNSAVIGADNVFPSSGSVGIGTTSPAENAKLDVNGRIKDQTGFIAPVGSIMIYAGATAPQGWLLCNGATYSRTTYSDLYNVIGTLYGDSNSSNFKTPNLKGHVIVGLNSSETEFSSLGKTGGAKTHTLTTEELPAHSHSYSDYYWHDSGDTDDYGTPKGDDTGERKDASRTTANTGSATAFNILQPYITLNYIIKY
ncbi:tail fiber protein [candidate division KSB1 bacterium]|nr:tail fiber protein [candidate division KSB1 bacterium]